MTISSRSMLSLVACLALLGACAAGDKRAEPATPAPAHSVGIQPLHAGTAQRFVQCIDDCTKPTPKTLKSPVVRTAATSMPAPVPPTPVEVEPDRYSITFSFNSATLTDSAQAELRRVAGRLADASSIHITGFTDNLGPQSPNTKLAEARAVVVMRALRDLVPDLPAEIKAHGQALCCYLASNTTEAGRESNRRAEIAVTRRAPAPVAPRAQRSPVPVAPRTTGTTTNDTSTAS